MLGVRVDCLTMAQTVTAIARRIESGVPGEHLSVNAACIVAAHDDPEYAADLAQAHLTTADGQAVLWGAALLGTRIPERVTGIDLMKRLLAEAPQRRWRVALVGAHPDVVARVARLARGRGVDVVHERDGYFPPAADAEVAAAIVEADPHLVFVGMPTPRKERFIVEHLRPRGARYAVAVGGAFDVVAGRRRRAPRLIQRAGLEWMVRLAQEPRRLAGRYTVTSGRFVLMVIRAWLRRRATR